MKNNEYNFNDLSFDVQDASSFVAIFTGALIPDAILQHYAEETPWFVKKAVEMLFFQGREIDKLERHEAADAFYINALIALQHEMKEVYGKEDFEGMLKAYSMPEPYKQMFLTMAEVGFSGAYNAFKQSTELPEQKPSTPWERRGISLN